MFPLSMLVSYELQKPETNYAQMMLFLAQKYKVDMVRNLKNRRNKYVRNNIYEKRHRINII